MKILWYRSVPLTRSLQSTLPTYQGIYAYEPDFQSHPHFPFPNLSLPSFPEHPCVVITFPAHFFQSSPPLPLKATKMDYIAYPSILNTTDLPFSVENVPFHFQTFAKQILTHLYFPIRHSTLTTSPWTEGLKRSHFSQITIEDWVFGALYVDFIPLESVWEYLYSRMKMGLRFLLVREWAILLKTYHQDTFYHPDGCRRIPFLQNEEPQFLEAWRRGFTGIPLVDACIHAFQTLGFLPRSYLKFLIGFATKLWQLPWRWLFQWYLQHVKVGESLVEESTFLYYSGIGESQITIVPFRLHHLITRLDPTGKFQKAWVPEIAHLSPIQLQRFPYFALSEKRKLAPSYMKQVPEKVANLSYSLLEKTYPQRIASAIQSSSFQKWLSPFLRTRKKGVNSILHDP